MNILMFVYREVKLCISIKTFLFWMGIYPDCTSNSSDILTNYPWFSLRPLLDKSLLNRVYKAGAQTTPQALHYIKLLNTC